MNRTGELTLLVLLGALPELIKWLTLSFDASTRGILILIATLTLGACVNIKAYFTQSTKVEKDGVKIQTTNVPEPEKVQ